MEVDEEKIEMTNLLGLKPVYASRLLQMRVQEYGGHLKNFSERNEDLKRFELALHNKLAFSYKRQLLIKEAQKVYEQLT